jgi:hypothetical protein
MRPWRDPRARLARHARAQANGNSARGAQQHMATALAPPPLGGGLGGPAAGAAAAAAGEQPALILITTVDIGDGKSDLIEVRQGDEPMDLARAFVQKHSLPAAITEALAQHLRDNLREAGQQQASAGRGGAEDGNQARAQARAIGRGRGAGPVMALVAGGPGGGVGDGAVRGELETAIMGCAEPSTLKTGCTAAFGPAATRGSGGRMHPRPDAAAAICRRQRRA